MKIKNIIDESFQDYKKPSMLVAMSKCNWKCCIEQGLDKSICQNSSLTNQPNIDISVDEIFYRYISNPLTQAIVIGGLEPILQFNDVVTIIKYFREHNCNDDIVIYTGHYDTEIVDKIEVLEQFPNIIVKYGRYIINSTTIYDNILGVTLSSDNQYGVKIS